jgi:hypothetical protein
MIDLRARNAIRWQPDARVLPARAVSRQSRGGGLFVTLFALAWCGGIVASIVGGTMQTGFQPWKTAVMLLFLLPGLGLVLLGLWLLVVRREVELGRERVTIRHRGLRGTQHFTVPTDSYLGVLRRVSGSDDTTWIVELVHPDEALSVTLFTSSGGLCIDQRWREAWTSFAELLDLPVLERRPEGVVAREREDVDRPLVERLERGELEGGAVLDEALGRQVDLRRQPGVLTVTCGGRGSRLRSVVWLLAWGGGAYGVQRLAEELGPHVALTAAFWALVVFAGLSALGLVLPAARHVLRVDSDGLEAYLEVGRRRWFTRHLRLGEIEDILLAPVGQSTPRGRQPLVVKGRERSIHFGQTLTLPARQALRSELLAAIAAAAGVEPRDGADPGAPRVVAPPARPPTRLFAGIAAVVVAFFAVLAVLMSLAF